MGLLNIRFFVFHFLFYFYFFSMYVEHQTIHLMVEVSLNMLCISYMLNVS